MYTCTRRTVHPMQAAPQMALLLWHMLLAVRPTLAPRPNTAPPTRYPPPPPISPYQHAYLKLVRQHAAPASAAARPRLLAALGAPDFRRKLARRVPALAAEDSSSLLRRLEDEFAVTEQVHNLRLTGADKHDNDVPIAALANLSYFPNLWEVPMLQGQPHINASNNMQEHAEVNLFGFKPFANESDPSWEDVSQRPIYIAHNLLRISLGNPIFGPVSVVFKPTVVAPMTFVGPVDSGIWEMSCNATRRPHETLGTSPTARLSDLATTKASFWHTNCSGWNGRAPPPNATSSFHHWPLGTMDHHAHLWLQNLEFWNMSHAEGLSLLFGRMFNRSATNLTAHAENFYMEANLAGAPPLPTGVSFIIGNFDQLFGSPTGALLRQICARRGWVLLWALDLTINPFHHHAPPPPPGVPVPTFAPVDRVLDPEVLPHTRANVSAPAAFATGFAQAWKAAAGQRAIDPGCSALSDATLCKQRGDEGCEWVVAAPGAPPSSARCVYDPSAAKLPATVAHQLWAALGIGDGQDFRSMAMLPLGGRSCAVARKCVGVTAHDAHDCVCYP